MRLLSFERAGRPSWGSVTQDGVSDLGARLGDRYPTLREAIAGTARDTLAEIADRTTADFPLADVRLLPPVTNPEKIICVGVNYANRNAEYADQSELPKFPSLFMRSRDSLVGHGEPIIRPRESVQLDYEGEIALVIGKSGRRIAEEAAMEHVFGLSCMNEGTVRDWLRHGKFNVTQGKNFDRSGSIGPWIVTADEFRRFDAIALVTRVNGEARQDDTTASLIFSFPQLLAYISTFTTLRPGDVIATGTPTGSGGRSNPPRWLKGGDRVEVSVAGVGTLANPVIDEG